MEALRIVKPCSLTRRLQTNVAQASADGLKGLCACQLAASPSAGRRGHRRRRQHRQRRYRAKYTPCQPSRRCGSSSRLMGCGMPDYGFGRCDGHHKMIDFRLKKAPACACFTPVMAADVAGVDDFEVAEATYRQWCAGQAQDCPA